MLKTMAKVPFLMILPPVIFAAFAGLAVSGMMRDNPDELPSTFVGAQAPTAVSYTHLTLPTILLV